MLKLSHRQQQHFDAQARERFIDDMAPRLAARAPHHAKALGDPGLRRAIAFGIDRAAASGYTQRGPVRLWLELMMTYGGRFDQDPLVPIDLRALLTCTDPDRQVPQARELREAANAWMLRTSGADNAHPRRALSRVSALADQGWQPTEGDLQGQALELARWIHPQMFDVAGEPAYRRLIGDSLARAERTGITTPAGRVLFPVLAMMVGAGFFSDPLYPWIEQTLNDGSIPDPEERAARLDRRARTYLRHAMTHLGID